MDERNLENQLSGVFIHGMSHTPIYLVWQEMKQRVLNPKNKDYRIYGHLAIDPRWLVFKNFYDDMGDRPEGMTIERIDNDKGYSKENCKWETTTKQARHRRGVKLTEQNVRKIKELINAGNNISMIANIFSVSENTIYHIKSGYRWKEVANV